MSPVEIEAAVSDSAARAFDAAEFPFEFLRAFSNTETTIQRLCAGVSNNSDIGGVLVAPPASICPRYRCGLARWLVIRALRATDLLEALAAPAGNTLRSQPTRVPPSRQ